LYNTYINPESLLTAAKDMAAANDLRKKYRCEQWYAMFLFYAASIVPDKFFIWGWI